MDKLTVVHANELAEASYSLSMNEMRVIALACTKVDSRKKNPGEIQITVSDFAQAYGVTNNRVYGDLRDAVRGVMRKPVKLFDAERNKFIELAWLVKNEYESGDNGSHVSIQFSPLIEPYLFELQERFTQIDFKYATRLNTPFSFRLYQWLKKAEKLQKNKNGDVTQVVLEIDWMKAQAALQGGYERWVHFRDRVIIPAVDKINSETDLSVIWEPIKQGRKIHAVQFNYVVEVGTLAKPVRPRLYRRPKVHKGSSEEGKWMRKNLALLLDYEKALKEYDSEARLEIKDLERIVLYTSICDEQKHKQAKQELTIRRKPKKAA